jgi:hypothetical protein
VLALAVAGCRGGQAGHDVGGDIDADRPSSGRSTRSRSSTSSPDPDASPTESPATPPARVTPSQSGTPSPTRPVAFDADAAFATVRMLAGRIGPREATSAAFGRAAREVAAQLRTAGYDVVSQPLRVPAGDSWGVPVPAGRTVNLIATLPSFDPRRPHRVVGAHLDSVPQAPGAEDNASGIAVMLELARMAGLSRDRLARPVLFVAFGAEEPRGPGDAWHHFGSRHYVRTLPSVQRRAVRGMVSLDRVGVGESVRIRTGGRAPETVAQELVTAARRAGVPVTRGTDHQSSDHWSFEKAGVAAARVGGNPFSGYHSPADRPSVVRRSALDRIGRLLWEWLGTR